MFKEISSKITKGLKKHNKSARLRYRNMLNTSIGFNFDLQARAKKKSKYQFYPFICVAINPFVN